MTKSIPKRWKVTLLDNKEVLIYSDSKQKVFDMFEQDVLSIEEYVNFDYLKAIEKIISKSKYMGIDFKRRAVYKFDIDDESFAYIKFMKEEDAFLDGLMYQKHTSYKYVEPVLWNLTTPIEFLQKVEKGVL